MKESRTFPSPPAFSPCFPLGVACLVQTLPPVKDVFHCPVSFLHSLTRQRTGLSDRSDSPAGAACTLVELLQGGAWQGQALWDVGGRTVLRAELYRLSPCHGCHVILWVRWSKRKRLLKGTVLSPFCPQTYAATSSLTVGAGLLPL